MKRFAMIGMALLIGQAAAAEPVFLPQAASVLKARQLEAGARGEFGYQKYEIQGSAGTTYKNRVWHFPLFARYGILDVLESHLIIPITRAVDSSEGTSSVRNADTGLGNIQLGAKWNFLKGKRPLAVGADFDLPTANPKNNPGALGWRYSTQIQQGFNAHLKLVGDTPLVGEWISGHATVGYMNTGKYTTSGNAKFNPSDLLTFGTGVNMKLDRWVNKLSVSGEFLGNTGLNHSKTDGVQNGNDKGTVLEAGPALRYELGSVRLQSGVLFDAGKTTFRAYNYRVVFGASYLWGGAQ